MAGKYGLGFATANGNACALADTPREAAHYGLDSGRVELMQPVTVAPNQEH
jgi:hypothetical protein